MRLSNICICAPLAVPDSVIKSLRSGVRRYLTAVVSVLVVGSHSPRSRDAVVESGQLISEAVR